MTSAYERANAVRTDSGGGGEASRGKPHGGSKEGHLFSTGFVRKRKTDLGLLWDLKKIEMIYRKLIYFPQNN